MIAVAAGGESSYGHTLALKSDGTVWAWGSNAIGQLGDGTTIDRPTPFQVPGLSGMIAVAAGASHSIALKNDGTVWRWGNAPWNGSQPTPQQVPGLSGVIAVAAGYYDDIALKNDGTVWRWNATGNYTPVQVSDTLLTINFTGNGIGSVSLSTGGSCSGNCTVMVPGNTTITLTPSAGTGSIISWSGCDSVVGNQCNVLMNTSKSITAQFNLQTFSVTPSAGPSGSINPNTPQGVIYKGTTTFTVTPNTGYATASVTGCGGTLLGNTYTTGPITGDCTVSATFAPSYIVTPSASADGIISPNTPQTVLTNGTTSFTVIPNTGYHIASVTGCGGTLSENTYTTGSITGDCTVSATFALGVQGPAFSIPAGIFLAAAGLGIILLRRKKVNV